MKWNTSSTFHSHAGTEVVHSLLTETSPPHPSREGGREGGSVGGREGGRELGGREGLKGG